MFSKLKKRASAVRFGFSFHLGVLSPWPAGNKGISIGWQRGSKRKKRGITQSHTPGQIPGQLGTVIEFNEVIQLSATLYMEGNAKANPAGPFKKKCLILAVIESDGRTADATALGRVVIDLAEFAGAQTEDKVEFPVACSKTIQAAVGDPTLIVTVRSFWKGAAGPGSGGSFASSLSSDKTGGTFTSGISSLVQSAQRNPGGVPGRITGEQMDDLRGFDRLRTIKESESEYRVRTMSTEEVNVHDLYSTPNPPERDPPMQPNEQYDDEDYIMESAVDTEVDVPDRGKPPQLMQMQPPNVASTTQLSPKNSDRISSWLEASIEPPGSQSVDEGRHNGGHQDSDDLVVVQTPNPLGPIEESEEGGSDDDASSEDKSHATSSQMETVMSGEKTEGGGSDRRFARASSPTSGDGFGGIHKGSEGRVVSGGREDVAGRKGLGKRWKVVGEGGESKMENGRQVQVSTTVSSAAGTRPPSRGSGMGDVGLETALMSQLRASAFLEASVYLARAGRSQSKAKNMHAPARRIIRTLEALGPEQGVLLTKDALEAIKSMVEGCGADVTGMAYWWSNCVQIRLLLPEVRLSGTGKRGLMEGPGWAVSGLIAEVGKLEKHVFDRVEQYLWWKVLTPKVVEAGRKNKGSFGSHESEDVSVHKWLEGLKAVHESFMLSSGSGKSSDGHIDLLRKQVLRNCCRRMDAMIFNEVMSVQQDTQQLPGSFFETGSSGVVDDILGGGPDSVPLLNDCSLPFKRGSLTFGVGMHIKMAVTRWSEWAFEVDVKDGHKGGEPGNSLFPLLKASADLLMMPKELLADESVRGDVFSALSLRSIVSLLERFQPDDFAPDPIDPAVHQNLEHLLRTQQHNEPAPQTPLTYKPPLEDDKTAQAIISDFNFDMDAGSEDELDVLNGMYKCSGGSVSRFDLLKELWLEKRDRRGRLSR